MQIYSFSIYLQKYFREKTCKGVGWCVIFALANRPSCRLPLRFPCAAQALHSIYIPQHISTLCPKSWWREMQRQHSFALILGKECPNTYRTLPEAAVYIHAICTAASGFFCFKSHQTILQKCHFCIAKRTILECRMHRFRMQNAPFCIAKSAWKGADLYLNRWIFCWK